MSTAAKKTAAPRKKAAAADPLASAHPLVGVAENVAPGPRTAEEQREAIRSEYGQYVATQAITHDGARAYNVGDAVPAANVEEWGYADLGLVARVGTVAADEAEEEAGGEPAP